MLNEMEDKKKTKKHDIKVRMQNRHDMEKIGLRICEKGENRAGE
jgi:hypothetical protein